MINSVLILVLEYPAYGLLRSLLLVVISLAIPVHLRHASAVNSQFLL